MNDCNKFKKIQYRGKWEKIYILTIFRYRMILFILGSVRIRVRIDSPHPFECRRRRLNGVVLRMRQGKPENPCYSRSGTIKIPPCSKALSVMHRPTFYSPSPVIVTSQSINCKIVERDYLTINNQLINDWHNLFKYCLFPFSDFTISPIAIGR
jgi:hypothetical protein